MPMGLIPPGIHYIIITCSDPSDPQFRGIQEVSDLLGKFPQSLNSTWDGNALELSRRKALKWILISGHGAEESARLSGGGGDRNSAVTPRDLFLPNECALLSVRFLWHHRLFGLLLYNCLLLR